MPDNSRTLQSPAIRIILYGAVALAVVLILYICGSRIQSDPTSQSDINAAAAILSKQAAGTAHADLSAITSFRGRAGGKPEPKKNS